MKVYRVKQKTLPRIAAFGWEILAIGLKQMVHGMGKARRSHEIYF